MKSLFSQLDACISVAACVCAKDGEISETERGTLITKFQMLIGSHFLAMIKESLNRVMESDEQIEDYLQQIESAELQQFTLKLAEESASSDGLDIRESIALQKAMVYWKECSYA